MWPQTAVRKIAPKSSSANRGNQMKYSFRSRKPLRLVADGTQHTANNRTNLARGGDPQLRRCFPTVDNDMLTQPHAEVTQVIRVYTPGMNIFNNSGFKLEEPENCSEKSSHQEAIDDTARPAVANGSARHHCR